jgi:hypothetical protein
MHTISKQMPKLKSEADVVASCLQLTLAMRWMAVWLAPSMFRVGCDARRCRLAGKLPALVELPQNSRPVLELGAMGHAFPHLD